MSDPSPPRAPRADLILPTGGGRVEVGVLGRVQGADGAWRYLVAVEVPAEAVAQIDGQDYSGVPTEREPAEPRFVLDNGLPPGPDGPRMMLHLAGCFAIKKQKFRPEPTAMPDAAAARNMLLFPDTLVCDVCQPRQYLLPKP